MKERSVVVSAYREDVSEPEDPPDAFEPEDVNPDTFKPVSHARPGRKPIPVEAYSDGYLIRDRFLSIRTVSELCSFFIEFGRLQAREPKKVEINLDLVSRLQKAIGWMLKHPVAEWGGFVIEGERSRTHPLARFGQDVHDRIGYNPTFPLTLVWIKGSDESRKRSRKERLVPCPPQITAEDVLTAMLATVHLDAASGKEFDTCARRDCGKPYWIKTKHKRSYCSQYCAHIVGLRRNRAAEKKSKRPSRARKQTSTRSGNRLV